MANQPSFETHIEGLDFLARQFADLEAKAQRKVWRTSLRKGARPVMKEMRDTVPVDEGDTKRAVAQSVKVQRDKANVDIGIRRKAKGRPGARVHLIEFGTSKMPARPFMRPAIDKKGHEAVERIGDVFREEIIKVTLKAQAQ